MCRPRSPFHSSKTVARSSVRRSRSRWRCVTDRATAGACSARSGRVEQFLTSSLGELQTRASHPFTLFRLAWIRSNQATGCIKEASASRRGRPLQAGLPTHPPSIRREGLPSPPGPPTRSLAHHLPGWATAVGPPPPPPSLLRPLPRRRLASGRRWRGRERQGRRRRRRWWGGGRRGGRRNRFSPFRHFWAGGLKVSS